MNKILRVYKKKIRAYDHEFSIFWATVLLIAGWTLFFDDIPPQLRMTLPYEGNSFGITAWVIAVTKYIGVLVPNTLFHKIADASGIFWFTYVGFLMWTTVPPMRFSAVILLTIAFFIIRHAYLRICKAKGW
jgi:hypothetical protein